ncbi:DUF6038 family protein [Macrococcus equi]|uniref:DUF6038 family protein n=1 Tax=Macrococcus equi TaxID=3395462 RepID=UPI0039BDF6CC
MNSKEIMSKMYSKRDICKELGISSYKLNTYLKQIEQIYNIDFKQFHNFNGLEKNNQYTFNGISMELLIILLKNIENHPASINGNKSTFNANDINGKKYTEFIRGIMNDIDQIKNIHLKVNINSKDIYHDTIFWLTSGNDFEKKLQEIHCHINHFPLEKKYELKKQIFNAIDETIFNFHNQEYIRNHKTVDPEIAINKSNFNKYDFELNYELYQKTLIPENSLLEKESPFETSEFKSIDILIVDMLLKSKFVDNPTFQIENTLGAQNKNNEFKRYSLETISKIDDFYLMLQGKTHDHDELVREHIIKMNHCLIDRTKKIIPLYYKNTVNDINGKSSILKKINTMRYYKKRANKNKQLTTQILKTKFELEVLLTNLIFNKIYFDKTTLVPKEYFMYMVEDLNLLIRKLDGYVDSSVASKYFPDIQMKVFDITNQSTKKYTKIQREILNQISNNISSNPLDRKFYIHTLTDNYKKELRKFRKLSEKNRRKT